MRDPNILLTTIAQITATFVAILGGFLLTFGLARNAELRRYRRRRRVVNALVAEIIAGFEALEEELDAELAGRPNLLHRFLPGQRSKRRQPSVDFRRRFTQLERQNRDADEELEDLDETIGELIIQLHITWGGLLLLLILGVLGIGVPVLLLPAAPIDEPGWREWLVQRGFLILLIAVLAYVLLAIQARPDHPVFRSRRDILAFLLLGLGLALTLPPFAPDLTVVAILAAVAWIFFIASWILSPHTFPFRRQPDKD